MIFTKILDILREDLALDTYKYTLRRLIDRHS